MEGGWQEGHRHAVECDLKSFFDTVNHHSLMAAIREKVRCRKHSASSGSSSRQAWSCPMAPLRPRLCECRKEVRYRPCYTATRHDF